MKNTNILPRSEKKIPVVEVFGPVLEGEGKIAGTQTFFIRFGLCDYKCTKCDSMHAVDPKLVKIGAAFLTQQEIFDRVIAYINNTPSSHIKHITFSGGNPAIHDLKELVLLFKTAGYKIAVETQGTKAPEWLRLVDHIVVSPKSPGMGEKFNVEAFRAFMDNTLPVLPGPWMSVKIVIFSAQDIEFASGIYNLLRGEYDRINRWYLQDNFYLSLGNPTPPVFHPYPNHITGEMIVGQVETSKKALVDELLSLYNILSLELMKDPRLGFAKFLPQLHVLAYGNETGK
jgi:7-carboxy-7-deazaguanine synthase